MNESDLPARLRSAADTAHAQPDLAEIELGAGRVRSRRRVVTGVVAAMLVAGAGGAGFGLGRAVSDDGDGVIPASEPEAVADPTATTLAGTSTTIDEETARAEAQAAAQDAEERMADRRAENEGEPARVFLDRDDPAELETVYERTALDGVRVHVQRGDVFDDEVEYDEFGDPFDGDAWQPAAFCYPAGEGRITIAGPDVVVVSWFWYAELYGELEVMPVSVRWADGRPLRVVVAQTAPTVTEVAVTWPDGAADRTPVVDGVAVLLADGELDDSAEFLLQIVTADGTRDLTAAELQRGRDPEWRAACDPPPPPLPEAGEQPADPAAAEDAVRERFDLIWDRSVPPEDKPGLIDDRTGIDAAVEEVDGGSLAEAAESSGHVIEELVFTSPTEVWFRYGIDTVNGYFGDRFGYADLVDGVWVFPRDLMCQDLALAGGDCGGEWRPIEPGLRR